MFGRNKISQEEIERLKNKINIDNFRREIEFRKLLEEQKNAEYTEEFPLAELNAMSIEGLEQEINKILLK